MKVSFMCNLYCCYIIDIVFIRIKGNVLFLGYTQIQTNSVPKKMVVVGGTIDATPLILMADITGVGIIRMIWQNMAQMMVLYG